MGFTYFPTAPLCKFMGKTKHDLTIVVPTRGRKSRVERLLVEITHRPLMLVVDEGRNGEDLPEDLKGATVLRCPPGGPPTACHTGLMAADTSLVVFITDDIKWEEANPNWLDDALTMFNEKFPDGTGVVGLNDGRHGGDIACYSLLSKDFYQEHLDWRVYERYSGDNEMTAKAKSLCKFAYCETALLPHEYENGDGWDTPVAKRDNTKLAKRMYPFMSRMAAAKTKPKLFIALPIFWNVDPLFFMAWTAFMQQMSGDIVICPSVGDSDISRSRNKLTRLFLETDCTHLLFIDTDLIFGHDQVERIMEHKEELVGGCYPKKQHGDIQMVLNVCDTAKKPREDKLVEVKYIGTGFMRVARTVFDQMIEKYGDKLVYNQDGNSALEYDFWGRGVYEFPNGSRRYLSEDWQFCQRWIDLGGKVWADTAVLVKHSGNCIYPTPEQENNLFKRQGSFEDSAGRAGIPTVTPAPVPA